MKRLLHPIACTAIVFSLFFSACGDDATDNPASEAGYLRIAPAEAFVFDESDPAKNTFTVTASADISWQAVAEPAQDVLLDGKLGSGDGRFSLTEMPAGTTVEIYVKHSYTDGRPPLESNRVKVSRTAAAVTLTVTPQELVYDESDAAKNSIEIRSNTAWTVASADKGVTFSPAEGTGNGTVRITGAPVGESTLNVTAGKGETAVVRSVAITRTAVPPADPVFRLDFGSGGTGWANQLDDWKTQKGSGSAEIVYASNNVRINNDNFGSAGRYKGASGGSYAKMFYDAATDYFEIGHIVLPAGKTDFRLTFGTICRPADLSVRLSADGRRWQEATYAGAAAYNTWTLAVCDFSLTQPVSQLFIRLQPKGTTQSYGLNFDDVELVESTAGGQRLTLEESTGPYRWPELPTNFEQPAANQTVHTHWATTVRTGKRVRNYTYCYDTQRHNPVWVAYPLHDCYQEGGYTRPAVDPWAPDPSLDAAVQSKIYPAYDGDTYNYYTSATLEGDARWSRGHLVMSSERGCGDKNAPALLNTQTFYPTNIAPQPATGTYTFGTVWGYVEGLFSGTRNTETEFTADDGSTNLNRVADTLFMVAGCHYGNPSLVEHDASTFGNLSSASKLCAMPTHQFKLALRTKKGNTGKRIQECDANELQAIGFWIPTYMTDAVTSGQIDRFAKSVAEIEQLTGLTFFPDVPASVKASFERSEWGF